MHIIVALWLFIWQASMAPEGHEAAVQRKGRLPALDSLGSAVHRIKRQTCITEKKGKKRDTADSNMEKSSRRVVEVQYKELEMAPRWGQQTQATLKAPMRRKTDAAESGLNMSGENNFEVQEGPGALGKGRLITMTVQKLKIAEKHAMGYDDGYDEDDDDDNMGPLPAFRAPSFPVSQSSHRGRLREALPAGCLLAHFLISCENADLTELPVIMDPSIRALYLPENNIRQISPQGLAGLLNLEVLDLSNNKLVDSSLSPSLFQNLNKLKRLNLDGNSLTKIPPLPPSLEELKMNDNKMSVLTAHSFKGLAKLVTLELEDNKLHDGSVSPLTFRPLQKLTYLQLEDNRFRSIPSGLPPSLQVLQLSDNRIEEVQEAVLNKTVRLKTLDLSHNRIGEDGIGKRTWMPLVELETLDLSHNKLLQVPSFLPAALRHLLLHHNHIKRIPAYVFGHLKPGLESLCLSHNQLHDEGLHAVSFVGLQASLTQLLLDHNLLQSVPRGLQKLKGLEVLRLNHNLIRSIPLKSICGSRFSKDFALVSVHMDNNLFDQHRIPPAAFSCIRNYQTVQLWNQDHEELE